MQHRHAESCAPRVSMSVSSDLTTCTSRSCVLQPVWSSLRRRMESAAFNDALSPRPCASGANNGVYAVVPDATSTSAALHRAESAGVSPGSADPPAGVTRPVQAVRGGVVGKKNLGRRIAVATRPLVRCQGTVRLSRLYHKRSPSRPFQRIRSHRTELRPRSAALSISDAGQPVRKR